MPSSAARSRTITTRLIDKAATFRACEAEAVKIIRPRAATHCHHNVPPRQINLPARHKQRRYVASHLEPATPLTHPEYSVLLLVLDNAGKTTLLEQIKASYTPSHPNLKTVPTVGQNTVTLALPPPNPPIYLKLWDVGGQHSLRGLWQSYYTSCHAIRS